MSERKVGVNLQYMIICNIYTDIRKWMKEHNELNDVIKAEITSYPLNNKHN